MEKLTKENIYIDLRGKGKEELTDLWEFLDNAGENQFRNSLSDFLNNYGTWIAYEFGNNIWRLSSSETLMGKTEITIEQLKQIIKPMVTFTPIAMKCTQEQFDAVRSKLKGITIGCITDFDLDKYLTNFYDDRELISNVCTSGYCKTHETWNEEIFLKACGIEVETKFKKGDIIIITDFKNLDMSSDFSLNKPYKIKDIGTSGIIWLVDDDGDNHGITLDSAIKMKVELCAETIQEQLQKAQDEVKRLQSLIEEENKPKVGDWVKSDCNHIMKYYEWMVFSPNWIKITNPELIKLLENECSTKN